jgi:hypothetical protein
MYENSKRGEMSCYLTQKQNTTVMQPSGAVPLSHAQCRNTRHNYISLLRPERGNREFILEFSGLYQYQLREGRSRSTRRKPLTTCSLDTSYQSEIFLPQLWFEPLHYRRHTHYRQRRRVLNHCATGHLLIQHDQGFCHSCRVLKLRNLPSQPPNVYRSLEIGMFIMSNIVNLPEGFFFF